MASTLRSWLASPPISTGLPPDVSAAANSLLSSSLASLYDVSAWRALLSFASRLPHSDSNRLLNLTLAESALALFGYSGEVLSLALPLISPPSRLERLLSLTLPHASDVSTFTAYLNHVRDSVVTPGHASASHEGVMAAHNAYMAAFDFTLTSVGSLYSSGPLYSAWLKYMREDEHAQLHETAKVEGMRAVYVRGVTTPHCDVESLLESYTAWEVALAGPHGALAQSRLAAVAANAATARAVARERRALHAALPAESGWSCDPLLAPASLQVQVDAARAWRRICAYELGNPCGLPTPAHIANVRAHMRAACNACRFAPELWFEFAAFEASVADGAAPTGSGAASPYAAMHAVLARALALHSDSVLLSCAAAHMCEAAGETAAACAHMDAIIASCEALAALPPDTCERAPLEALETLVRPCLALRTAADGSLEETPASSLTPAVNVTTCTFVTPAHVQHARGALDTLYCVYMDLKRRVHGLPASRALFAQARKRSHTTSVLYLHAATLEWYTCADGGRDAAKDVALRILEAGRKQWPTDVRFICACMDFLCIAAGPQTAVAFGDASLADLPPAVARPVWDRIITAHMRARSALRTLSTAEGGRGRAQPALGTLPALARQLHRYALEGRMAVSALDALCITDGMYDAFHSVGGGSSGLGVGGIKDALTQSSLHARQGDGIYLQSRPHVVDALTHVPEHSLLRAIDAAHKGTHARARDVLSRAPRTRALLRLLPCITAEEEDMDAPAAEVVQAVKAAFALLPARPAQAAARGRAGVKRHADDMS